MKTLSRPMFRRGGSTGEGITSGLRQGYKRGRVVEPGGYQGDEDPNKFMNLMRGVDPAWKKFQEHMGPRSRSTNFNDFLINFGLDIASRPPQGGLLSTAAASAKDPFAQFQQRKAYEEAAPREEKKDFLNTYMTSMAEMLGGESAANIYKHGDLAAKALDMQNKINAHNDAWKEDFTTEEKLAWDREKKNLNMQMDKLQETTGIDLEFIMTKLGDEGMARIQNEFRTLIAKDETLMVLEDGTPAMDPDDPTAQLTVSEYYKLEENHGKLEFKILQMIGRKLLELQRDMEEEHKDKTYGWTHAEGGRAGYVGGKLVEQMDVDVMTPKGEMAMQETVEEGVEPDQLSYEELRARLPVEITDDIIRLMVSSADALADFAQIQTQQDVDNFNAKYGVNLVLPSEA